MSQKTSIIYGIIASDGKHNNEPFAVISTTGLASRVDGGLLSAFRFC